MAWCTSAHTLVLRIMQPRLRRSASWEGAARVSSSCELVREWLSKRRGRLNGNKNKDRRLRNCELSVVVCSNYIRDTNDGRWPCRTPPFALASCTCSLALFHKTFLCKHACSLLSFPLSQRTTHSVAESLQRCSAKVVGEIAHGPTTLLVPSLQ